MTDRTLRGKVAVVGVAETEYYKWGQSPDPEFKLAIEAVLKACADAGIDPRDVDGFSSYSNDRSEASRLAAALGCHQLSFASMQWGGGGGGGSGAVANAAAAIATGQAECVVVLRALAQGQFGRFGQGPRARSVEGPAAHTLPYGLMSAAQMFAMKVNRFMHEHGVRQGALRAISLASYTHAQTNPRAVMYGRPLDAQSYDESRWIVEPFHLFDCCQENDGAAAVVVTTGERARDLPQPPAYILAGASGMESRGGLYAFNDSAFPLGRYRTVGEQLWERAGVKPGDIDVIQFYENFSGTTLTAITDIGFCPPEGLEEFVSGGNLQWPDGRLPLNTSGGNLAEAYIHGFQLVNEAVRQIRGQSTCQVADVELSLSVAGPGTPPSSAVLFAKAV